MEREYREIEFLAGDTIDMAVNELLKYKDKGILACGKFNGVMLYSDTVTLDDAYIQITGKTKAEREKEYQEWKENYEREEREHKEKIHELSKEWMKRGREILTEDYWSRWDEIVSVRLNDIYRGMELGCCIDIIRILNNGGTINEAKSILNNQNHSGTSYDLVRHMVKLFCDRGNEFYECTKFA